MKKSSIYGCLAAVSILSTFSAKADNLAYVGVFGGDFGTINLDTGVVTLLGSSGQTLGGMGLANGLLYGTSFHVDTGTLYTIDPANGNLTAVGNSMVSIDDFGSTPSGLFAVGIDTNLYSINSTTGAATLIGPTGLSFGSWRCLSTNSSTLFFANGPNLYTLDPNTGAATLVGNMGGPQVDAIVFKKGLLYAGQVTPDLRIDILDPITGAATIGPPIVGTTKPFYALAPIPLPSATPTPPATATPVSTTTPTASPTPGSGTPTPTPVVTATPTPTVGPSASASPFPTPGQAGNISTRLRVETSDNVLIGGFIITGTQSKRIILRAIGPSLAAAGVPDALADPTLELHDFSGLLASNDNWMDAPNRQEIIDTTIAPTNDFESAILMTLPSNSSAYTAIVRGVNNSTGVGLVEAYDLGLASDSKLANISTRGFVQTGDNVLIGGLIIVGQASTSVIVRAIGPSLSLPNKLPDPTLELRDGNGGLLQSNDNWRTGGQEAEIIATTIPPSNDLESAIVRTLIPGAYTAIVRGTGNGTGVGLIEVYDLGPP